jgi:arabinose-5-phosphate isomerase
LRVRSAPKLAKKPSRDLEHAREVIRAEAQSVLGLLDHIGAEFLAAVDLVDGCEGRLVISGMGKSGFIAQKLSATLASTGIPSLYLHPAEALHGDLGRLVSGDIVLALSNSGETDEIIRLLRPLKRLGIPVIAMTSNRESTLASVAEVVLDIGDITEACPIGLVPTASTTTMLVLGDALVMAVSRRRGLSRADFARYHPGGKIGQNLLRVSEVMRRGESNPIAQEHWPLTRVLEVMTQTPGRPGAASIVNKKNKLVGVFTDGDLRRLLEHGQFDPALPIKRVMTALPKTVRDNAWVEDGERLLREHAIDNMPVVNAAGEPVGLLDVQDLLTHHARLPK